MSRWTPDARPRPARRAGALAAALTVTLLVLGLFCYWFLVADRYAVFLYGHLGATPFDGVTGSRYWMCGLVAGGYVLLLYTGAAWLLGRWRRRPPAWWRVWLLSAALLGIGIPAVTLAGSPPLPPRLAVACAAVALASLALALLPSRLAAERPADLAWLALDGLGLVPVLLLGRAVELPGRGLGVSSGLAWLVACGAALGGALWLGVLTVLRARRRRPSLGAGPVFLAGLAQSYLCLPLAHHLLATPPQYRYISAASNFLAFSPWVQAGAWLAAGVLAVAAARLRRSALRSHLAAPCPGPGRGTGTASDRGLQRSDELLDLGDHQAGAGHE